MSVRQPTNNKDSKPVFSSEKIIYQGEKNSGGERATLGYDENGNGVPDMSITYLLESGEVEVEKCRGDGAFNNADYESLALAGERLIDEVEREYKLPEAVAQHLDPQDSLDTSGSPGF